MMLVYEQAVKLMNQYPELQHFVGKRDSALVDWAEKTLDVVFPPSYREFLLDYGAGKFDYAEFYGITNIEKTGLYDSIHLTLQLRNRYNLPHNLVYVTEGIDCDIFIETGDNPKVEYPVVTYICYIPENDRDRPQFIASSFSEFFLSDIQAIVKRIKAPSRRMERGTDADLDALFKSAFEGD